METFEPYVSLGVALMVGVLLGLEREQSAPEREKLGEPEQIVDSVYDFASQLLELNKQFVHQLLEASTPKK